ncbi:unnamed protein product [Spirodela intermedia]|uniref:Integrase catalytic domain-containing protein n=1 Tax=Spirodela intermedia TaxID=51605 RepID=A0A7I8KGZ8_SPIIN|nr:unnamed protein product [Spirodela intermedia]
MNFIEGLPKSHGSNAILVVVDRLSKYNHFIALNHPFSAKEVAQLFLKEIVRLHGFPKTVVSDRGQVFLSTFWRELHTLQGTELKFSSSYHPQTDGQIEVVNRCLENYLRCAVFDKLKQWKLWLHWAEYSYNTSYHSSTKMTPFRAIYVRNPPKLIKYRIR